MTLLYFGIILAILISVFIIILTLALCKAASDADRHFEKERQDWLYPKNNP